MNNPSVAPVIFRPLQPALERQPSVSRLLKLMALLAAFGASPAFGAATSLLDLNSTSPGFYDGSSSSADLTTTPTWTTDSTGVAVPVTLPAANTMQIGTNLSDFNGAAITLNMSLANNLTGAGLFIVSTNVSVTMSGTANCRWNNAFTWSVAPNSTLLVTDTGNNNGFNFNSKACTFAGAGTINFQSAFCANGNAANNMNMPGGTLQLNQTKTSNFGAAAAGAFTLTAGTLQFGSATALADVFAGWANNNVFSINGGTIDNTSGSPGTLNMGASGRYSIGGDFTFAGSSDLSLGNSPVTNTANHTITVSAGTLTIGGVISGAGGGLTKAGPGRLVLGGANTYTGSTVVKAGTLGFTNAGSIANSAVVVSDSTLDTSGSSSGALTIPTLSVTNAVFNLGLVSTSVTNLTATTLNVGSPNVINITALPLITGYPTTLHLIQAATVNGALNFTLGTIPAATPAYVAFLTNRTASGAVDLVITGGPVPVRFLTWSGLNAGSPDGTWDVATTPTWLDASSSPVTYNQSDLVTFNDNATGQTNINMTTTLLPGALTISNNTRPFVLGGGGKISGAIGLLKQGNGTLVLDEFGGNDFSGGVNISSGTLQVGNNDTAGNLPATGNILNNGALVFNRVDLSTVPNIISGSGTLRQAGAGTLNLGGANTFTGAVTVASGTLQIGNSSALGTTNGNTTVANGATLDFVANANNIGQEQVLVSGSGVLGGGAIVNSSGSTTFVAANVARVTMTGDTTFGGSGRWDLRSSNTGDPSLASLSTLGQPRKLTKVGGNQVGLVGLTVDPALGDIEVQSGILSMEAATTSLGNTASNLIVYPGGTFQMFAITNLLNKIITLSSDGIAPSLSATSGTNNIIGPITFLNDCSVNVNNAAVSLTFAGPLSGAGKLLKNGAGLLTLSGNSAGFVGGIQLNSGNVTISGALNAAAGITTLSGKLLLNGTSLGGGLTNTGGTLAGFGTNLGPSDLFSTITPGDAGVAGTLTLAGTVLEGSATLVYDLGSDTTPGNGTNDLMIVNGDLTVNGNIVSINPLGVLQIGVPYRLFTYTGNLTWNADLVAQNAGTATYTFAIDRTTPGQVNLIVTGGGPPVWNGGSPNNSNWSDPANWHNVAAAPGGPLYFAGTTRLNNTNDTAADLPYSDLVFNPGAGSFVLNGNPIVSQGNIINRSSNPQTLNIGLDFGGNFTIDGGARSLRIGGGLTNTAANPTKTTITLAGTGILTNLFASIDPTGTNTLSLTNSDANWTLVDNASSTPITVPWAFDFLAGSFTFGTTSSAPVLSSTSVNAGPQDNRVGNVTGASGTFNMVNGTLTTIARLNTATVVNSTGIVNQAGGTLNIGQQFQGANGANANELSLVNLSGGTMNIGGGTGQFYIASRGSGVLTVSGSGVLNCGTLDLSRSIVNGTLGTVNLNGGTITASRVGTATANQLATSTGSAATFNFNGGILRASASSGTYFQGSTASPSVPINTVVKAGGARIDSDTNAISLLEPLQHDSSLGATPDGGLIKFGPGTLTLTAASSYTGPTIVSNGTLAVNGSLGLTPVLVGAAGTLAGSGSFGTNLTVLGTLSPAGAGIIGALTTAGNVSLQGVVAMDINKTAGTKDLLTAANIAYGGTLSVSNLAGTLVAGDSFKLFNATTYSGSFTNIVPATPGVGLAWGTTNLNVNGTLSIVASVSTTPVPISFTAAGGSLQLSWPPDHLGWRLQAQTNAPGTGLGTNWVDVPGSAATTNVVLGVNPANASVFYRLVYP